MRALNEAQVHSRVRTDIRLINSIIAAFVLLCCCCYRKHSQPSAYGDIRGREEEGDEHGEERGGRRFDCVYLLKTPACYV